jgi:hypothetical protein
MFGSSSSNDDEITDFQSFESSDEGHESLSTFICVVQSRCLNRMSEEGVEKQCFCMTHTGDRTNGLRSHATSYSGQSDHVISRFEERLEANDNRFFISVVS